MLFRSFLFIEPSVSNAGHYSPIIINNDGSIKRNLNCAKGIPIGILEESEYTSNIFDVAECPMICMFTDGVLEIKNKEKEEYGITRLEEFLKKNYYNNQEKIIENIKPTCITVFYIHIIYIKHLVTYITFF